MTDRTQDVIRAEIAETRTQNEAIRRRLTALSKELGEAQAREAERHPWLGKKVVRTYSAYGCSRTVQQRGIVAMNTLPNRLYSRKGHNPAPGETYVQSESGFTFYQWEAGRNTTDWELA